MRGRVARKEDKMPNTSLRAGKTGDISARCHRAKENETNNKIKDKKPSSTKKSSRLSSGQAVLQRQVAAKRSQDPDKDVQCRSGIKAKKESEMKRKTRRSGVSQRDNPAEQKEGVSGSQSPRKRRLRSFDKVEQQLISHREGAAKPSVAKKIKSSCEKMSNKSTPAASTQVKNDSTKKTQTQKGKQDAKKKTPQSVHVKQSASRANNAKLDGVAKSTPKSLYDFTADSPKKLDSSSASENRSIKPANAASKTTKTRTGQKQIPVGRKTRLRNNIDPSLITKSKRCRVVLSPVDQNRGVKKKIKVKADIHSQGVGCMISLNSQKNKKLKSQGKDSGVSKIAKKSKTKQIRPLKGSKDEPIPKMPSVSFLDNEISVEPYDDDSAIFLSPKNIIPRVKQIKAQETPIISGNVKDKRLRSIDCSFKAENIQSTSTPNPEPKSDNEPIRDQDMVSGEPKLTPPVFSPVKQVETPTSDYGSMAVTPSPERDDRAREHSPSPAFSLEDDFDSLNVNKSIEKSYRRSKKKFHKSRISMSKVDQWAEKVNSEMLDIENFELSVEG